MTPWSKYKILVRLHLPALRPCTYIKVGAGSKNGSAGSRYGSGGSRRTRLLQREEAKPDIIPRGEVPLLGINPQEDGDRTPVYQVY